MTFLLFLLSLLSVLVQPFNTLTNHDHFGVAITSSSSTIQNTYNQLGTDWWYVYGLNTPSTSPGNGVAHIAINPTGTCCQRVPVATLQASAAANPGGSWIIGNEPNVPGQDNVTPTQYATEFNYYFTTIRAIDPTARFVGPNILNWDTTCLSGCGGFTQGHAFTDQLRTAYYNQYGTAIPINIWGIHLYAIDWYSTPMDNPTDIASMETELTSFSNYLAAIPAQASKPIWLSEFGIVWAYQGWTPVSTGCVSAPNCIAPTGSYDQAGVSNFLTTFVGWLQTNGGGLRVTKWFLFQNSNYQDTDSTVPSGIMLMTDNTTTATLTTSGILYKQLSQ